MQITQQIHALRIPFKVPVTPELSLDRFVYVYLIFGQNIYLIDSGVAGTGRLIVDYLERQGRRPAEIAGLILTHAHPDHVGGAKTIKEQTNCPIYLHEAEIGWAEEPEQQFQERPVPGFHTLVEGPVAVDEVMRDGDLLQLEPEIRLRVFHTPGHSPGSISLLVEGQATLLSGDALIPVKDIPIYDDIAATVASVRRLQAVEGVDVLLSSWDEPLAGAVAIEPRIAGSLARLQRIQAVVCGVKGGQEMAPLALCRAAIQELGLPPAAANPLVVRGLVSSLAHCGQQL
jgi:hydroxyacylglutathione hydrolase